jgi:hypothetical protein
MRRTSVDPLAARHERAPSPAEEVGIRSRGPADVRIAPAWSARFSPAVIAWVALAGCVSAPTSRDWMEVGYRTPVQTVRTFQTAVRAEEPDLELRCFSNGFRERNHISRFAWREFFDELEREQPFLRKGIADAKVAEPVERKGDSARIVLSSHGVSMRIDLVLEGSGQVWAGEDLVADEDVRFADPDYFGVINGEGGARWIYARMPLASGVDARAVTEMRLAREWKIDGIETLGEASGKPSSARSPPR